jgi:hypothetical protein
MTDHFVISGVTVLSALSILVLAIFLKKTRDQKQALEQLANTSCVRCGQAYGPISNGHISRLHYHWTPLPGNTLSYMYLPGSTLLIKCSHCGTEAEFREDGQVFVQPLAGVFGYRIKSRP